MDQQLLLFRRQYYQLFEPDFLAWPPKQLLRDSTVQAWLYTHLFDSEKNSRMPPERYQLRVLKLLASKIEKAIEDPEEDVGAQPLLRVSLSFLLVPFCSLLSLSGRKYQTISCPIFPL